MWINNVLMTLVNCVLAYVVDQGRDVNNSPDGRRNPTMRIKSARITEMPKKMFDPMPKVFATLDNGEEKFLFEYYPDELSFTPDEFVGLTFDEAHDLRHKKDVAYLQS